ncbi:hypothetical protein PIB30_011503 [Stylosanthes scabra]|uniref:Uncharacterized protein n=1 Tax=Stylosanthes scabra TaxID=79078 RepID=A0ABU6S5S1_9FABA|nr:hypothetical protein [Stylosanthes scabra]
MERKRAAAAEGQAGSLAASLKACQVDLSKATELSEYWRSEWHTLGSEVTEMCQKTLDICLDQESEVEGQLPPAGEVVPEQDPTVATHTLQPAVGDAAGSSGECPTENL